MPRTLNYQNGLLMNGMNESEERARMPIDPSLITDTLSRWQTPQFQMPDPLAQYAKIQALKNGILQQQTDALDLQQKQKNIADQAAIDKAFADSRTTDAAGNVTYDRNKVLANVPGSHVATLQKTFNDADLSTAQLSKAKADAAEAQNNLAGNYLLGVHDAKYDPDATRAIVIDAVGKGVIPQPDGARILQQINQDPTPQGVEAVIAPFMARSPAVQKILNDRQEAQAKTDTVAVEQAKEQRVKDQDFINSLGSAQNPDQYAALIAQGRAKGVSPSVISAAPAAWTPEGARAFAQQAMTEKDREEREQAALNERNIEADRKITQAQNARRIAIEGQNAGINAQKFAMEFGGDAVKGWAKQIADNPDTANQVPPALRTAVMQRFTADTGLPYPKPLAGTAVDQERAARNALDAVAQIKTALQDPEVKNNIGPIMGRLANAEQRAGTAIGLSPSAEAKAQQLRTNMRYLLLTEAKAQMGGRVPQQVLQALEQSSPNVKMDADMLQGAMAGVSDASNRNLDQTYKQRFGENAARPGSAASAAAPAPLPNGGGKLIDKATAKRFYDAAGGDPAKTRALIKQNNWTLQ
jgi:hypothetical protein